MSLRDELRKRLDSDTLTSVLDQLGDDFNFDLVPRSRLNKVIEQRDTYKDLYEAGTQPSGGSGKQQPPKKQEDKPVDIEALRAQVETQLTETLQAQFANEKAAMENELRIEFAGLEALRNAGAHDPKLVWGLLDKSKITRDAEGKVSGLEDQITAMQESKAFLFGADGSKRKDGSMGTGKNSGNSGSGAAVTKDQFLKMSYEEQVNFKTANPEIFKTFLED